MPDNIVAIATSAASLTVGKLHIATCKQIIVNMMYTRSLVDHLGLLRNFIKMNLQWNVLESFAGEV